MLTTLAFLAVLPLAPAEQGSLSLTAGRLTYGLLGPSRLDDKLLPGDRLFFAFSIDNISADKDGKAHYSSALEVTDASGKVIFQQPPREQEVYLTLGGNSLPGSASVSIGLEQAPGEYSAKVVVKD